MVQPKLASHMHFRIAPEEKLLVEQAASVVGLKPNTYARQRLLEAANKDIEALRREQQLILDPDEWEALVRLLEQPHELNDKLLTAAKMYKKMVY